VESNRCQQTNSFKCLPLSCNTFYINVLRDLHSDTFRKIWEEQSFSNMKKKIIFSVKTEVVRNEQWYKLGRLNTCRTFAVVFFVS
jgi:hypothetical protein